MKKKKHYILSYIGILIAIFSISYLNGSAFSLDTANNVTFIISLLITTTIFNTAAFFILLYKINKK